MQHRHLLLLIGSALGFVLVAAIVLALRILQPTPPRKVVMSSGPEGSAYAQFAERYREILARDGIELEIRASDGASENLARLNDTTSDVSIGLLPGGMTSPEKSPALVSLGTLFYEPLWAFYRSKKGPLTLAELEGKKWSIGPHGGAARLATMALWRLLGLGEDYANFLYLPPREAGERLLAGDIDVMMLVDSAETPLVRSLLGAPDIELIHFRRVDAYTMLYPFLTKLVLPEGVGNLALNRPSQDVALVAFQASLVVREDLHPAIQMLLLDAALEVHGSAGMFHKAGRFPAAAAGDFPISRNAAQYYKSGRPFLQRYLPFWLAVFVAQLIVAAIPFIGILYPGLRLMPALYGWTMRRRIYRLYGELKHLEQRLDDPVTELRTDELAGQLDRLEHRILHLSVPTTFSSLVYTLRQHISLVRARLDARRTSPSSDR